MKCGLCGAELACLGVYGLSALLYCSACDRSYDSTAGMITLLPVLVPTPEYLELCERQKPKVETIN